MAILWSETESEFGITEKTVRNYHTVVSSCDSCSRIARIKVDTLKRQAKKTGGKHICHKCATTGQEFKDGCSTRASALWQDESYKTNNLAVVQSDEYREQQKVGSISKWNDPEYRSKMTSVEATERRRRVSSAAAKKKWTEQEYRDKLQVAISKRMTAQWLDDNYRRTMAGMQSKITKQLWDAGVFDNSFTESFRLKMAAINAEILARPEVLTVLSKKSVRNWLDPDYRKAVIEGNIKRWQDPDYREKMAVIRSEQSTKQSAIQTMLYEHLDSLGIHYCKEGEGTRIGYYCFDCLIPRSDGERNLLIECQGDYWHGIPAQQTKDRSKFTYIDRYFPEYELVYVWEHEFYTKDRVLDRLRTKLGIGLESIDFKFGDVVVKEVPAKHYRSFLNAYHYIGKGRGGRCFGAYLGDELIACCVLSKPLRQNMASIHGVFVEISRFCIHPSYHKKNFASWLLSKLVRLSDVPRVVAYADTTVGHHGIIYKAANFKISHEVSPDYWYVDNEGYVMHKRTLYGMAVRLKMTESEFADKYGYIKKWGGKKLCYVYDKTRRPVGVTTTTIPSGDFG